LRGYGTGILKILPRAPRLIMRLTARRQAGCLTALRLSRDHIVAKTAGVLLKDEARWMACHTRPRSSSAATWR
jgi:hypothetical protein